MDSLTRYYMRKANLQVQDEYRTEITQEDIFIMTKARAYILICPVIVVAGLHLVVWL